MKAIGYLVFSISLVVFIYGVYQLIRNSKVYKIRQKWIETDDNRLHKYSYDYMFDPSKHNWFGLKFPTEKAFPIL